MQALMRIIALVVAAPERCDLPTFAGGLSIKRGAHRTVSEAASCRALEQKDQDLAFAGRI